VPAVPPALQPAARPPLIAAGRPRRKNAAVVLAQQATLTQAGQALRAINRQPRRPAGTAERSRR
jgi:hypothetical protein